MRALISFITISILLLGNISKAQNYSLINPNRQYFFNEGKCIRIDSIATNNGDSIFFNYKQIFYQDCYVYSHESWIGKKVIRNQNNDWVFITHLNDSLVVKPYLAVGSKWYSGNIISSTDSGRVDSIYFGNFLGLTDSIKSITIFGCNNNIYCYKQILISKNYGIIQFLDLGYNLDTKAIKGLTNPMVGKQNLSGADIFDFLPGDEYHVIYKGHHTLAPDPGAVENYRYEQHNILSSFYNGINLTVTDSVYQVVQQKDIDWSTGTIIYTTTTSANSFIDGRVYSNQVINQFNKLSFENTIDSFACNFFMTGLCVNGFEQTVTDSFDTKTTCYYGGCEFGFISDTACLYECIIDGVPYNFYTKKMGGPYYHEYTNWQAQYGEEYYPVYHKRGNLEEGTPIQFESILNSSKTIEKKNKVIVFPNPVNDVVTFSNIKPGSSISIYNLFGEDIINTNISKINTSEWSSGFYFFRISNKDGNTIEGKFVKE